MVSHNANQQPTLNMDEAIKSLKSSPGTTSK